MKQETKISTLLDDQLLHTKSSTKALREEPSLVAKLGQNIAFAVARFWQTDHEDSKSSRYWLE